MFEDEVEAYWQDMLDAGALVLEGMEGDEPSYTFNVEIMKEKFPEFWAAHLDEVDEAMLALQSKGLVELDFTNPEIGVELTEKGRYYMEAINQT